MVIGWATVMNYSSWLSLSFAGLNKSKLIPLWEDFENLYSVNMHDLYERERVFNNFQTWPQTIFCYFPPTEHLLIFLVHQSSSKYILGNAQSEH